MFLIVLQNCIYYGIKYKGIHDVFTFATTESCANYVLMQSLLVLSLIGVNCFVMITGYFSITNTSFRLRQVSKIFLEVLFYAVVLHFIVKYIMGGYTA